MQATATLRERPEQSHDQRPVALALCSPQVDNQAAVLHRHHLADFHDAGFAIHLDLGHLHATDAAVGEIGRFAFVWILPTHRQWHRAQLRASLLPGERPVGSTFDANHTFHALQLFGLGIQGWSNFLEQGIPGIYGGAPCRGTHASDRRRATRTA